MSQNIVRCIVFRLDIILYYVILYYIIWYGMIWYDIIGNRNDMVVYYTIWNDMIRYDIRIAPMLSQWWYFRTSLLLKFYFTGISRFDDLQLRIPRNEVMEIEKIVRDYAERLNDTCIIYLWWLFCSILFYLLRQKKHSSSFSIKIFLSWILNYLKSDWSLFFTNLLHLRTFILTSKLALYRVYSV